ncbi:hypothetical protein HPB49_012028 [Dermacentor silvarum]|uniref:Uncharacterized protein n=1 Tax=Dermacentor silvarum TaxID=543639 RepID=A0ACB8DCZ7_DERSI|nr:hypothetical protein HPB49_012028 [Dermacentor silvarum]
MFEPPRNRKPQLCCSLPCPQARSEDLPALVSRGEKFLAELQVSEEMINYVESWPHNSVGHEECLQYEHRYTLSQLDQENLLSRQAEILYFSNSVWIAARI